MTSEEKQRIRSLPGNNKCCDCSAPNPSWISLSHGTLICMECSGRHRGLGVHISFVRSLDLDILTEKDVKKLEMGGNQVFRDFMIQHGAAIAKEFEGDSGVDSKNSSDAKRDRIRKRYDNDVARLYRESLKARVEGRTEPTMDDLLERDGGVGKGNKDPEPKPTDANMSTEQAEKRPTPAATNSGYHLGADTSIPSPLQRFMGGCKYWTYRLVGLPLRNNRWLTVSFITLYILNKLASKIFLKGKLKHGRNDDDVIATILTATGKIFTSIFLTTTTSILALSFLSIRWFHVHRQAAFKSAINEFIHRVETARAKRNPLCDLYFPPNASIGSPVSKAVIFFPDVLVDKAAYATVMGKLSDAGVLVAVVNLDPLRIPTQMQDMKGVPISSSTTVLRIAFEVQKLLGMSVEEWVLMGHGEGACAVTDVIRNAPAAKSGKYCRCVLWSPTSFLHDLSHTSASVLVVHTSDGALGSGEVVAKILPRSSEQNHTMQYVLGGGSHSGFAHYGPGTFKTEKDNRTKTLVEQQKEVRDLTLDFILQREPSIGKKD